MFLYHKALVEDFSYYQLREGSPLLFLVTLRDVERINDVYDLEITLEMAIKIFASKVKGRDQL